MNHCKHIGILVSLAATAHAQRLNLGGGPAEPRAGEGVAALALAERLEKEQAPGAAHAVRALAASLLRSGENAGPAGAEAVLAGLTLAAKREAIDAMLAAAKPEIRDAVAASAAGGAPSVAVRDVDLLLRDAIGPLVQAPGAACGWTGPDDAQASSALATASGVVESLLDNRRVDDAAQGPLREMVDLFALAPSHPAYTRSALEWAELLAAAADALAEPPAWLDMPARDQVRTDLSSGAMLCIEKPEQARAVLGRTARVMRIVREIDALAAPRQTRELRDAVNRLAGAAEGSPLRDPAAVARIDEVLAKALGMIDAVTLLDDPTQFVRQTRPMLGPLADAHRRDAETLARLLPGILGSTDPMTDPAVVAAVSALTRTTADLLIPAELTELLVRWPEGVAEPPRVPSREPVVPRATAPLAERIRTLGVALAKPETAGPALAALRALRDVAPSLREFPGERELRAGVNTPAWQRVTGGEIERLGRSIDQARADWLQAEATEQFASARPGAMARVHALEVGLLLLRDAAAFEQVRLDLPRAVQPVSNSWPGSS
ncbi:MAG: hypothetical protein IPJ41_00140 [Phycisphaerales bacterium]|nr:hypothetical protein [Phycisphaerales bacterium]